MKKSELQQPAFFYSQWNLHPLGAVYIINEEETRVDYMEHDHKRDMLLLNGTCNFRGVELREEHLKNFLYQKIKTIKGEQVYKVVINDMIFKVKYVHELQSADTIATLNSLYI